MRTAQSRSKTSRGGSLAERLGYRRAGWRHRQAVVWIDGRLHAANARRAAAGRDALSHGDRNDPETLRILSDVIILFVHANPAATIWWPTGMRPDPTQRSFGNLPRYARNRP
jgi:hypothetical protein